MRLFRELPRLFHLPAWLALGGLLLFAAAWVLFPFPKAELIRYPAATTLFDREGEPLRMRLGPGDTDCRLRYRPDPRRDWICQAVVASEDQRFRQHHGVDPLALGRALIQNIRGARIVSGASTISTQVVRLMHPRRRTPVAKCIELFRALQLETILGKDAILEQYLNRAPFGANLVGVEAASRRYFGKEPADLSLAEAAMLAGLPQSPSRLRPDRFPERARKRQRYVLDRMAACGMIGPAQRITAEAQPIVLRRDAYPFRAPHFCDLVLEAQPPGQNRFDSAATARTTLDPALQRTAEAVLRRHAESLRANGVFGGAVVVIDVTDGGVRALVGSPDYRDAAHAGQVNGAIMPRSAGSTLKPFAYALAIDQGRLTPGRVLADIPRVFRDYTPANFDGTFRGLITAQESLVRSLNLPALSIVEQETVPEFLRVLRQSGLNTLTGDASRYGLGLALGNGSVRLLDLANAYACFARGGEWRPYRLLEAKAATSSLPAGSSRRVFSPEAAWLVAEMLSGDERADTTTGHRADARLPRIAWKTGTSSGFRDAWAVAFNPRYAIGVWIGNPDGRASPVLVGARAAVPVMWDLVRAIYPSNDAPWFDKPAGVSRRAVCTVSGCPPNPVCPHTVEDWCIAGVTAAEPCAVHRLREVSASRSQGGTGTGKPEVIESWPPEIAAFLQRTAAREGASGGGGSDDPPRLVTPQPGGVYRKLDDVGCEQRLALQAETRGGINLFWFVDDVLLTSSGGGNASWPLVRGRHTIVCCDAEGRAARASVTVE